MNRTLAILLALLIIGLTALALGGDGADDAVPGDRGGVLLRYRLEPGDVQVYQADIKLAMEINAKQPDTPQDLAVGMTMRLPFSISGTERRDDGTMLADLRFHGFRITVETTQGDDTITFRADEQGLETRRNGQTLLSGQWGSTELGDMPDLRTLLDVTLRARFNDRAELLEMTGLEGLASGFQGMDLSQGLNNQVVYPENPVAPGDTWEHDLTQQVNNPAVPGASMTVAGKATYTVLGQVTHRNRSCLKLGVEALFENPEPSSGINFEQTVTGTVFVDIATGVPLDCRLELTQRFGGSTQGVAFALNGTGSITISYLGGKRKLDELTDTAVDGPADGPADGSTDALRQLEVPMITGEKIRIGSRNYARGDVLTLEGEDYTVVAFKPTALKLHRKSDSAVFQLGVSSQGRITYIKLLGVAR